MKKYYVFFIVMFLSSVTYADITLTDGEWSTTHNCDEWDKETDGLDPNCDGFERNRDNYCTQSDPSDELHERITSDANYSGGGGGRGHRKWHGYGDENESGGLKVDITNTDITEFWMRWYSRFENGFSFDTEAAMQTKMLNIYDNNGAKAVVNLPYNADGIRLYTEMAAGDAATYSCSSCGWTTQGLGDGTWHYYEIHLKVETVADDDGVFQLWVDGVLKIDRDDVDYNMYAGSEYFNLIVFGSNSHAVTHSLCMGLDYDDIAISTNGYIGSLTDETAPTPSASSVNGSNVSAVFTESVTVNTVGTWTMDCDGDTNYALTLQSGSGTNTLAFTSATAATNGQTCDLTFVGGVDYIEDDVGNDLADFTDFAMTNNTPAEGAPYSAEDNTMNSSSFDTYLQSGLGDVLMQ